MSTEAAIETEIKAGPGRFNNPEAFCWIDYATGSLDKMKTTKVWNSRDGKVPPSFKHPSSSLTYTRVPRTEVSAIDEIPGIGEFIFIDENSKGEPKLAIVNSAWQEKHRRLYSNPQAVINRLEGIITSTKSQLEKANQTVKDRDEEIRGHKDNITNLQSDMLVLKNSYAEKDKQMYLMQKEITRLAEYEKVCNEHAEKIAELAMKGVAQTPEENRLSREWTSALIRSTVPINPVDDLVKRWKPVLDKCPEVPEANHSEFAKALEQAWNTPEILYPAQGVGGTRWGTCADWVRDVLPGIRKKFA